MKINKASWHYKLWKQSFTLNQESVPEETDFCRYCHKVFWRALLLAAFTVMCVASVAGCLVGFFYGLLWKHPLGTLIGIAAIAVVVGIIYIYNRWLNASRKQVTSDSLVSSWLTARKQKVCPLVEFTE